ncbi:hypothetical protein SAY87_005195 [Trapa incisa]|uniref:Uncharacterized protein n=1 Tax=Trapa incisa TaxID=236973 RepID=A0AAN7K609_9MYRT|nr:hypothetical protein SAY87_005195 [Trapa incisa]
MTRWRIEVLKHHHWNPRSLDRHDRATTHNITPYHVTSAERKYAVISINQWDHHMLGQLSQLIQM